MPSRTRNVGEFCWTNMLTAQPAEAMRFFGALLGWTFKDMAGMGYVVRLNGRDIGGLFDLHGVNTPKSARPGFGMMIKVDDAEATRARVIALGGSARPAFDILDQGRMAVCLDPNGAEFDIWQPKRMNGFDVDSRIPGAPTWFETLTTDTVAATTFYESLFGWRSATQTMPGGVDYTVCRLHDVDVAGLMALPAGMLAPPHWGVYFTVTDVDDTSRQAVELGGSICVPPRDIPGVGRFSGVVSPQGVTFYPLQYGPPADQHH